jgi:hypothetical protein
MDINCPECRRVFQVDQKYAYHAGFSNVGFLYCDTCPNLVVFSSFDPRYEEIVGKLHPWTLNLYKKWKVERQLITCTCGGHFRFSAPPRCPLCNEPIPSILPDSIHFIETGKRFNGEKESVWKP